MREQTVRGRIESRAADKHSGVGFGTHKRRVPSDWPVSSPARILVNATKTPIEMLELCVEIFLS